ncbi:acyl-CoA/acyl-ACP dehydrogenase [Puniceicoccaceae bacterium K14]|nr:acyl-CoA/acyl-ACP dehydrogenase [Puniceicoccaceae bacterium K14]
MNTDRGLFPIDLTENQIESEKSFVKFVEEDILPIADKIDREDDMPESVFERMTELGLWGAAIPKTYGGMELDNMTLGLLARALGRGNASILSLLIVHSMVGSVLSRWGTNEQKQEWLPKLAKGDAYASLALTEPQGGSDASNLKLVVEKEGDSFRVNGKKTWISGAQHSDVAIVVGSLEGKPTAFLIDLNEVEGLSRKKIQGMVGFRGAMLAELDFENCLIPKSSLIGRVGFGFSIVAGYALDLGRLWVSWGCCGISESCLKMSVDYSAERMSFGNKLLDHQLIQKMIADMMADVTSSLLVCYHTSKARDENGTAVDESAMSKYIASTASRRVSDNALQIFGAAGCSESSHIQRYWRDAKIMELIEGTTQIQQILLGRHAKRYF